ncbi:MAG TPA: NfeD family protein [Terracidiphilus sp.]|nr:NfeD family protein [Terracidiphilus sp.]
MNWESFYMICFLAGLMLSAVSLLGGMGHFGGHVHLHLPHGGHLPHGAVSASHPGAGAAGRAIRGGANVPWWNAFSLMIFLCWFGAAGFLLTRYGTFLAGIVVVLAMICGVAGGALVFVFLTRVLMPHDRELTADETDVVGAVGHVSAPIRAGGTGEIVYEQLGALRSAPARAEDGEPIQKQEEVYVTRYEKGIAYVRRWEEISDQGSVVSDQIPRAGH